ncbi:hypothetical protein EDD22DRAFT_1029955 [Suillus occidentalis]|nr:hypothetical protein EDD22DRAFT_1029955 [Suillus occidentalis]
MSTSFELTCGNQSAQASNRSQLPSMNRIYLSVLGIGEDSDHATIEEKDIQISLPIWRLPTEILSEIFLYCLPEDEYLLPKSVLGLAPMLLTTICRRWREFAVNLPGLWCSLQLASRVDFQHKALGYDSWLKRSQGCPLSLRIDCSGDLSELRHLLQPYIQQITSLTLYFSNCNEPFMIEDFHSLKELTIYNILPNNNPNRNININLSLSRIAD